MFMKSSFIATTQIDSRFQLVICKRCSVIQWNVSFLLSSSPRCIYTNRLFERRSIEVPQIRNKITKCKPAVGFQLRFVVNRITFRLCELVLVTAQVADESLIWFVQIELIRLFNVTVFLEARMEVTKLLLITKYDYWHFLCRILILSHVCQKDVQRLIHICDLFLSSYIIKLCYLS